VLQLSTSVSPEGNHDPKRSPGEELKPLLDSLMKLCLAVAGAQRGAVVLARENALVVHAVGSVRQPTAFEPSPLALSTSIIAQTKSGKCLPVPVPSEDRPGGPSHKWSAHLNARLPLMRLKTTITTATTSRI
jgi:hypothetical protein